MLKIGGEVAEDRGMTKDAFDTLIGKMVVLQGDLCPQKGQIVNPFNTQAVPDLSCPCIKFGGRRRTRKTRKTRKNKKRHTRRR